MCGSAALDNRSSSTIGIELAHNRAAGFDSEAEFVADATATLATRPPNAEHVVALNRGPLLAELAAPARLSPRAVAAAIENGAVLVDARTNEQFDEAHVPGAISASAADTGFATKVAQVVSPDTELIVVAASDDYELAAAELLGAVGLKVTGFLAGGMTAWRSEDRPVARVATLPADRLDDPELGSTLILDVRDADEYESGHVEDSLNIPYAELGERLSELPRDRPIATVCSGGKRSGLAASILQREGFDQVIHVTGGIT